MVKKNSPAKGWLFGGFSAAIATKGKSYGQKNCKFAAIWAVIICYKQKLREEKTVLCQAKWLAFAKVFLYNIFTDKIAIKL